MAVYCTNTEIKAQIDKSTASSDTLLTTLIAAASEAIDRFCRRPDGFIALSTATARKFTGTGKSVVYIDECAAITLVEVKDSLTDTTYTAWAVGDWLAGRGDAKTRPDFNHTPYTWLMVDPTGNYNSFTSGLITGLRGFRPDPDALNRAAPTVQVTAKWGFAATVPPTIKQACIMQTARWYKRGQSGWADAVGNPEMGLLLYRKELDPDIRFILVQGKYVKRSLG